MEILRAYQTKNPGYKRARAITPVGVLVHSTGAVNRELRRYVDAPERLGKNQYNNHWNRTTATKSMHAFIGYDKDKQVIVAETLPHGYACSGCGSGKKGSYNYNPAYLQFEICQGSNTDADYYWRAIAVAEEYCAHLCQLYGWTSECITSHVEAHKAGYASNHGDPSSWMKYFGDSMDKFRARVAERLASQGEVTPRMYVVTGTRLALREGMSTSTALLLRMDTDTIVEGLPVSKDWVKITHKGKTGYSMAKFLAELDEDTTTELEGEVIDMTTLRTGSRGTQVLVLQWLLDRAGHAPGEVDGIFGEKTTAAVKRYQKAKGLAADGIVGHDTWTALLN